MDFSGSDNRGLRETLVRIPWRFVANFDVELLVDDLSELMNLLSQAPDAIFVTLCHGLIQLQPQVIKRAQRGSQILISLFFLAHAIVLHHMKFDTTISCCAAAKKIGKARPIMEVMPAKVRTLSHPYSYSGGPVLASITHRRLALMTGQMSWRPDLSAEIMSGVRNQRCCST
ncbi:MAG: hypothetical protein ACR2PI_27075 [Hyphomicrobiaceae bacterium]